MEKPVDTFEIPGGTLIREVGFRRCVWTLVVDGERYPISRFDAVALRAGWETVAGAMAK